MKKFTILLVLVMLFTMCSCSSKKQVDNTGFEDEYSDIEQENTNSGTASSDKENEPSGSITEKPSSAGNVDYPTFDDNRIIVACWGDSITQGMGITGKSYPSRLAEMLGVDYNVLNGGDAGESTAAIAARQGGLKVYTSQDIVFGTKIKAAFVAKETQHNFITKDGRVVELTSALGNGISVNNVTINGNKYKLEFYLLFI